MVFGMCQSRCHPSRATILSESGIKTLTVLADGSQPVQWWLNGSSVHLMCSLQLPSRTFRARRFHFAPIALAHLFFPRDRPCPRA